MLFLQRLDRRPCGDILTQGNEIRHHDTTGGVVFVAEQTFDLLRPFLPHFKKNSVCRLFRQFADDVCDIIGGHIFQNRHHLFNLQSLYKG